jgi:hypothetical protein
VKPLPLALALLALPLAARSASGQLRPTEPPAWSIFDRGRTLEVEAGAGLLPEQRISLAGMEGRLVEVGNVRAAWRSGRIAVQAEGTTLRLFHDQRSFAPPYEGTRADLGPDRHDSGDWAISTLVRLTPDRPAGFATLRFGARLPNSDNVVGIDRDRTDFFALVGGQLRGAGWRAAGEAGLGINGSHRETLEQADVLVYDLTLERPEGLVAPFATWLGQRNDHPGFRGNESLSELRLGARVGHRYWLRLAWVHGFAEFSPGDGVLVSAGVSR